MSHARRVLIWFGLACVAWPVPASHSPIHPVVIRAFSTLTVAAQWNMDETSRNVMNDSSGNGNNGTLYDVQTTGSGYVFNGTSSKVVVPNSASLNPGASDFTYTAQVQTSSLPATVGTDFDIIRKGAASTSGGGFRMEIENHKGVGVGYCSVTDSVGHTVSVHGTTNVVDGQPHTLSCQKISTGLTLVTDNRSSRTTYITGCACFGSVSNTKPLTIGVSAPNATTTGEWYNGSIHGITISVGECSSSGCNV